MFATAKRWWRNILPNKFAARCPLQPDAHSEFWRRIDSTDSLLSAICNQSTWLLLILAWEKYAAPHLPLPLPPPFLRCLLGRATAHGTLTTRSQPPSRGMKRLRDLTFPFQSNSYVTSYFKCIAMYSVHILNSFDGYKICPYFSLPTLPDFPFSSSCVSSSFTMKSNSSSVSGWTLNLALVNIANFAKGPSIVLVILRWIGVLLVIWYGSVTQKFWLPQNGGLTFIRWPPSKKLTIINPALSSFRCWICFVLNHEYKKDQDTRQTCLGKSIYWWYLKRNNISLTRRILQALPHKCNEVLAR